MSCKSGTGVRQNLEILKRISSLLQERQPASATLESALENLLALSGTEAGLLTLLPSVNSPEPLTVRRGLPEDLVTLFAAPHQTNSTLYEALEKDQRLSFDDVLRSETSGNFAEIFRREELHFFVLYPVRSVDRLSGALGLASQRSEPIVETQEEYLQTALQVLGVIFSNLQLHKQAGKLSDDVVALQEMNKIISQSLNLDQIVHRIVAEGKRQLKTSQCHLLLVDERNQGLAGAATTESGLDVHRLDIKFSEPSLATAALAARRVLAVEDVAADERTNRRLHASLQWRSAIFAPLMTKDHPLGVLIFSESFRERAFKQEEVARADALAQQTSVALENARFFQAVSRSQREWEATVDAMQDCVSVHDMTGKVIRANLALARKLKTTPHKIIGKYCSEIYNAQDSGSPPCRHRRSLQPDSLTVEEVELPQIGGTFQISVSPWYDKTNRPAGSIHVAKDVSNEKLLQQQLIQSEKLSAIGELISGIAHELNNPLTGVMGYSQLLQLRKDLDERAKDSLLKINNLALRCQKIVQNLLSFARKQKPERILSDVNEIIERTIELRNYELQVNNIEIERDLDRHLPKTIADAHQLQQVFLNLITNAEQAMLEAHGRGKLAIRSRTDDSAGRIIVEVADDGPGIPETQLSKIFDPFFTTKEVGKGTGLGLSLSYGIIKEHDGNIYVRSRAGEGASFFIELPVIAVVQDESHMAAQKINKEAQFEAEIRDKRILVVDDEKYILDFFSEVFRMYPTHVDTASNGQVAIERLRLNQYDLIITDFKMPKVSGRDLFTWVQRERPQLARRMIFVTGDTVSVETRTFFEDGSRRYLAKPFKIEEIKEVIHQMLEEVQPNGDERPQ